MTNSLPTIQPLASLQFNEPELKELDNGIPVYAFNGNGNPVVKVDIIFEAGRWTETKHLQAAIAAELMKSGSKSQNAFDIEESIDYLGSTISVSAGYNTVNVQLYCLSRNLEAVLAIAQSILNDAIYPKRDLKLAQEKRLARLKVNQMKNDYVADMAFKALLFGEAHPYGYVTTEERISAITSDDLQTYYQQNLNASICSMSIAGNFEQSALDLLNKYFGQQINWTNKQNQASISHTIERSEQKQKHIELLNSVQASIIIGKPTIDRRNDDYIAYALLNMIFGGYFGSRLMSNLREDKGLTYGIYAYTQNFKHASAFIIQTDSAIDKLDLCLQEIYFEMQRLREEIVPEQELNMARNYMLGRLLAQVDGPFKSAATFMGLRGHGLDFKYLKRMEAELKAVEASSLPAIADKYLTKESMYEVVAK